MSEAKGKPVVPGLSIDEALALFLSVTYPNGLPEGLDREAFLHTLREKIAADRPEWAASQPPQAPDPQTAPTGNYSQIKAGIVEQAQQPDVPTDPGERYFYERHEAARRNREQREAQEREDRIKDELRQRLIAENQASDEVAIERVLRIRQSLEARLQQALRLQTEQGTALHVPAPTLNQPARFVMEPGAPTMSPSDPPQVAAGLTIASPSVVPASVTSQEFLESLKHMEPAEQVESLRQFNQARREMLKPRAEVLNPRRPARSKRDEMLVMAESETSEPVALALETQPASDRARPLELSEAARPRSRGLRLEAGRSK